MQQSERAWNSVERWIEASCGSELRFDAGSATPKGFLAEVSVGDEFGGDADGNFGDGLGADIEAKGSVDLVEGLAGDAFA